MAAAVQPAPREEGWTRVLLATAAFLLLARAPGAQALLPIVDTFFLLLPLLTACFVAGWAAGGPPSLAIAWFLLTAVLFAVPATAGSAPYQGVTRAWGLLVAAAFALLCVFGARGTLLRRGLYACAFALAWAVFATFMLATGPGALERIFAAEFAARNAATTAMFARWLPAVSARFAGAGDWASARTAELAQASSAIAAPLVPALLVLEALAACALAWALYHRLSRARLGPPLTALRAFTFGHAPVWALIAGGALLILPTSRTVGFIGANVVVVCAALFAVRGAAVAAWFLPIRRTASQVAAWAVALVLSPVSVPAAFGVGLVDSWLDWRGLARARQAPASPAPNLK